MAGGLATDWKGLGNGAQATGAVSKHGDDGSQDERCR
jgi:hypothetical protein